MDIWCALELNINVHLHCMNFKREKRQCPIFTKLAHHASFKKTKRKVNANSQDHESTRGAVQS